MLSPEQEEEIIAQAIERGLLKPEQVELHAPESRSPPDPRLQSSRALELLAAASLLPPPDPRRQSGRGQVAPTASSLVDPRFISARGLAGGQPASPSTNSGPPASSRRSVPPTYGPRLDRLRKLGLIGDATIEELQSDLRSAAATSEAAALPPSELAALLAETAAMPPVVVGAAGEAAVKVQIPLPDALRRWTRYEITEVLGQGGMGVVYKARDRRLGRTVALKFIRLGDPKMVQRFVNEARAQARITHDNICKVYEVDEVAGQPYIAMEFIAGDSVLALSNRLSLIQKLRLILEVAEALHAAHRLGIIHRDIKPQNVLVEVKADGKMRPVLMDFGLARDVRSRMNLTETGIVLGTPEYMSPEQARGTSGEGDIDCRSDVYSLGAMLYELLVGQPPFEGSTSVQVLIAVLNDEIVPVRERNPSVPEPLETIVMKCLSKRPEGRYPTARAMAEELGRFLIGEPIIAQRPTVPLLLPMAPGPAGASTTVTRAPTTLRSLLLGALAVMLLVLPIFFIVRARLRTVAEQRDLAEQSRQAQLFEKDVRAMELFMRAAYGLPLHNIRSEQEHVRQLRKAIELQLPTLAASGRGPAEYALGRAAMVLDEWVPAEEHLLRAILAGFSAPQVHFALGLTYGVRFQRAADEARRYPDRAWAAQRLRELERELLIPARRHMEQGLHFGNEAPSYALALLEYYRQQLDAALVSVNHAAAEAPWLPEIVQLEARLLRERVAQSGNRDLMRFAEHDLERAGQILLRAVDMARSNPFLYMEQAELGLLVLRQRSMNRQSLDAPYAQVIEACQKALVAQPDLATAYGLLASAEAYRGEEESARGQNPAEALSRGAVALSEAERLVPGEAGHRLTENHLNRVRVAWKIRQGVDALPELEVAARQAKDAVAHLPTWSALWVDLGRVYVMRADFQVSHGQEARVDLEAAIAAFEKVMALQPKDATAKAQIGHAQLRLAQRALGRGEDPLTLAQSARQSFSAALGWLPDEPAAVVGQSEVLSLEAEYRLLIGEATLGTLQPLLRAAVHTARAAANQFASRVSVQRALVQALRLQAQALLLQGQDPTATIADALGVLEAGYKLRPGDAELLALEGELHLTAARWQLHLRRSPEAELGKAIATLQGSLAGNQHRAATFIALGRVYRQVGELALGPAANRAFAEGLQAVGKALDIAPGSPSALLEQGLLLLGQAQRAPLGERASIAEPALAALNQAVKLNPFLAQEAAAGQARSQQLIAEARAAAGRRDYRKR